MNTIYVFIIFSHKEVSDSSLQVKLIRKPDLQPDIQAVFQI